MSDAPLAGPAEPILHGQFETVEQQEEANTLGMWLFLAQEIMFFGGLFAVYGVYRLKYYGGWVQGSHQLSTGLGALNTTILLLSSLTMAMAVYHTQRSQTRRQVFYLAATLLLGGLFLFVKFAFEWTAKYQHGMVPGIAWHPDAGIFTSPQESQMFFVVYFIMTGMHALHIVIGILVGAGFAVMSAKGAYGKNRYLPIEFFGFYWHFVDIVWVFLFPLFYLVS